MSEMLMFKQKKALNDSLYSAKYSHAIVSYSRDFYPVSKVNDYALNKYGRISEESTYKASQPYLWTTNAIFIPEKTDRLAVSLALGFAMGGDITTRLYDQIYLTGSLNIIKQLQGKLILQKRILDGNPTGLSLGATYGKNFQMVSNGPCLSCSIGFHTNSVGLRMLLIHSPTFEYGWARPFFYFTGSANYDIDMNLFYPRIGFSFGYY